MLLLLCVGCKDECADVRKCIVQCIVLAYAKILVIYVAHLRMYASYILYIGMLTHLYAIYHAHNLILNNKTKGTVTSVHCI